MRIIAVFKKVDGARHISHLDLQRAVQRALRRAGLPVRYSQGFNPHMILSFASALSLGFTSVGEVMDVAMTEEVDPQQFEQLMSLQLPPALGLVEAHAVPDTYPGLMGLVASVDYAVTLKQTGEISPWSLLERFLQTMQSPLEIEKKTKAGPKNIDIRPLVLKLELDGASDAANQARFFVRCAATKEGTLNPRQLFDALKSKCGLEFEAEYCRLALWGDSEGSVPLWRVEADA